jgi:hypothetical protein
MDVRSTQEQRIRRPARTILPVLCSAAAQAQAHGARTYGVARNGNGGHVAVT